MNQVIRKENMSNCRALGEKIEMLIANGYNFTPITASELYESGKAFYKKVEGEVDFILSKNPLAVGISMDLYRRCAEAHLRRFNTYFNYEVRTFTSIFKEIADNLLNEDGLDIEWDKNPLEAIKKIPAEFEETLEFALDSSQDIENEKTFSQFPHCLAIWEHISKMENRGGMISLSLKDKKELDIDMSEKYKKANLMAYTDKNYWHYAIMSKKEFYENKNIAKQCSLSLTSTKTAEILGINLNEDNSRAEERGVRNKSIINRDADEAIQLYIAVASECNCIDVKDDDLIRYIKENGLTGYEEQLGSEISQMLTTFIDDKRKRDKLVHYAPDELKPFINTKKIRTKKQQFLG